MPLAKTRLGRQALAERCKSLRALERQILILANGQRTRADFDQLLGSAAGAHLDTLLQRGLLYRPAAAAAVLSPAPALPAGAHKRSAAASKMYVLDMLQRVRHADAASWRVALHSCETVEQLGQVLCRALEFMHQQCGASVATKAARQLMQMVPSEILLPVLAFADERLWLAELRAQQRVQSRALETAQQQHLLAA